MSQRNRGGLIILAIVCVLLLCAVEIIRNVVIQQEGDLKKSGYCSLKADESTENPLAYINDDFSVKEGFHSNLPIVILTIDGELSEYKRFVDSQEIVDEQAIPYTNGGIKIIDSDKEQKYLTDQVVYQSNLKIKKRGHTSFTYDKSQYLMKMEISDGISNDADILGMGQGNEWILNGSMADKSMIRNYLPYRIASEIGGNEMAPDSQFCEVLIEKNGRYEYGGVYLLMETVSRGEDRIDIESYNKKNAYTSYIVRRDRYTAFDVMLETYGRLNNYSPEWIGVKYPSEEKLTESAKNYIQEDFSKTEQVIYSRNASVFKTYDRYIQMDTYVDYFLINEYFGNYDAGEHSTYMFKDTGGKLHVGPVWDFDQAMNNYFMDEMDPYTLAFQTKPIFAQLAKDKKFIDALKKRYAQLRKGVLSEEHVFEVMDEAVNYLKSARVREWTRWKADYEDSSFTNLHNYYLQDYEKDNVIISRFNDNYDQELYNIRTYLHKHGTAISIEIPKLNDLAEFDTSLKSENELLFLIVMILFLVPSIIINRQK